MKRITAAYNYDNEFWNLHENGGYEEGVKLEQIISDLGYDEDFFPESGDPTATDEQYEEVLSIYREQGGNTDVYSEEDIVSEIMDAVQEHVSGARVRSFEDVGMMTRNLGFVVYVGDKEYQFELLGSWR